MKPSKIYYYLAVTNLLFFLIYTSTAGLTVFPVNPALDADVSTVKTAPLTSVYSTSLYPSSGIVMTSSETKTTTDLTTITTTLTKTTTKRTEPSTTIKPTATSQKPDTTTKRPGGSTTYIPEKPNVSVSGGQNTVSQKGSITILKLDIASNKPIQGVVFQLTGNGINKQATTDSNGKCYFADLPEGKYTVKELSGPPIYENITSTQIIQLNKFSMHITANSYSRRK